MNLRTKNFDAIKIISCIGTAIADIICPKSCIICGKFINIGKKICICRNCLPTLNVYGKVIRNVSPYYDEVVCALPYNGRIKKSLREFKFHDMRYFCDTFSYALCEKIKERDFINETDIICPVPIHIARDRKYNQSALIAKSVAERYGITFVPDLLYKSSFVTPLSKMEYKKRIISLADTIDYNIKYEIMGKTIILVDDVYTTGSTTEECSRVLKMFGAERVIVICACYAEYKGGDKDADANFISD